MLPMEQRTLEAGTSELMPIWMAALLASGCRASGSGGERSIEWHCVAGRAEYTNGGMDTEMIQPFGVPLARGETIVVSWITGDTGYTVKLYHANSLAA
jgi:hypothetical protein